MLSFNVVCTCHERSSIVKCSRCRIRNLTSWVRFVRHPHVVFIPLRSINWGNSVDNGFYCRMRPNANAYSCLMAGLWSTQPVTSLPHAGCTQLYVVLELRTWLVNIETLSFYFHLDFTRNIMVSCKQFQALPSFCGAYSLYFRYLGISTSLLFCFKSPRVSKHNFWCCMLIPEWGLLQKNPVLFANDCVWLVLTKWSNRLVGKCARCINL